MGLWVETLIVSLTILFSAALPFFWKLNHRKNSFMFLVGTGALTGIVVFDLLPDLWNLGGKTSIYILIGVWLLYSAAHLLHLGPHAHDLGAHREHLSEHAPEHTSVSHIQSSSIAFILASMMLHCFASGVFLSVASGISLGLEKNVFYALIAHKFYEAVTVSSVVVEKVKSRSRAGLALLAYSLSLPFGVIMSFIFKSDLSPSIAMIATSVAAATLLGCLVFDFWLPTIAHLRHSKRDLAWIIGGLFLTQAIMMLI